MSRKIVPIAQEHDNNRSATEVRSRELKSQGAGGQETSDLRETVYNDQSGSALLSLSVETVQQKLSLEALSNENSLLRHMLAFMPIGFCMFDQNDELQLCNQQFVDVWNLPLHVCRQGTPFEEVMAHSHGEEVSFSGDSELGEVGQKRREWLTTDGRRIDVLVHVLEDGTVLALHEDVTDKREAEHRIAHLARFDALTDLYNRGMLYQKLEESLVSEDSGKGALLYLDLNGFKQVNDTLGHPVGDKLLVLVAQRIRSCCRATDMVARLGGDEFAVVMTDLESAQCAEKLSQRIIALLAEPFDIDGRMVFTSTSIGIASFADSRASTDEIVMRADMALYEAKTVGGGVYRHFAEEMEHNASRQRQLESDLRKAIENHEFELHYQPQFDIRTMKVCGAEAQIRWNHPERGLISPAEFIPVAETIGLILPIGSWILREACKEAMHWPESVTVAVKVSSVQFGNVDMLDIDFQQEVKAALAEAALPASRLELNMTESVLMQDVCRAREILNDMKALGVRITADEFGSGRSSLRDLCSFQLDHLKIDHSFITPIVSDADARSIVRTLVLMGRNLGMSCTAVGVETQEQLDMLRAFGCARGQGDWMATSCTATEFRSFVEEHLQGQAGDSQRAA